MYLIDTNVISEYRKGARANPGVRAFFAMTPSDQLFIPVQAIGEIQSGIGKIRRRGDIQAAALLEGWLDNILLEYEERIIDFAQEAARLWGMFLERHDPHAVDKQIAAIALIFDMIVVTRDRGEAFLSIPGLKTIDPFSRT